MRVTELALYACQHQSDTDREVIIIVPADEVHLFACLFSVSAHDVEKLRLSPVSEPYFHTCHDSITNIVATSW